MASTGGEILMPRPRGHKKFNSLLTPLRAELLLASATKMEYFLLILRLHLKFTLPCVCARMDFCCPCFNYHRKSEILCGWVLIHFCITSLITLFSMRNEPSSPSQLSPDVWGILTHELRFHRPGASYNCDTEGDNILLKIDSYMPSIWVRKCTLLSKIQCTILLLQHST